MRLEVRKSGGPECDQCGSYEMVKILGTVDAARDVTLLMEREWAQREREIGQVYAGRLKDRDERVHKRLQVAVARPKPRSVRFLKRRWQERLEQEIEAAIHDLLRETRL